MALTVEDGTGLSNADALISESYADNYHTAQGNTTWTGDDKEAAIRRASAYLTDRVRWQGYKVNERSQAMAWPRSGVVDVDGYSIPEDEVPDEVKRACAEIALVELVTPGAMSPQVTASAVVTREKLGPMETEYATARTDANSAKPQLAIVQGLLKGLTMGAGGMYSGRAVRA